MDPDFWHQRWQEGRIGFHQPRVLPLLKEYWDALELPRGSQVFVPLAGKSLDMIWLASRGHRVLGVEISPLAVAHFFQENGLVPDVHESRLGEHHVAGDIELICGDVFDFDAAALADCEGVYDRAALIALPTETRQLYVDGPYANLPGGCRGLLITLEYPQAEKSGPPFSVAEDEVRRLYSPRWRVDLLERREILDDEPKFAAEGITALSTAVYGLDRLSAEEG